MERIKLVSMNVAGLNDKIKRRNSARYLTTLRSDIVGLQWKMDAGYMDKIFGGQIYQAFAKTKQKDVMIGIKSHLQWKLKREIPDEEGRYIIIQGTMKGENTFS